MPPAKAVSVGKCIVPMCTSQRSRITTHRIPKDPAKAEVWLKSINNPDLAGIEPSVLNKCYVVCKLHFSPDSYVPQTTKPTLKPDAVPSLILLPTKPAVESEVELLGNSPTSLNLLDCPSTSVQVENIDGTNSFTNIGEPNGSIHVDQTASLVNVSPTSGTKGNYGKAMKRNRSSLLRFVSNQSQLSPKARHLYSQASKLKKQVDTYRRRNLSFKERIIAMTKYSDKNN